MRLYKTNEQVIGFKNNPAAFLHGITSNDLNATNNAFLNIYGKIVATFAQKIINEDEIWICIEKDYVSQLLAYIERYVKLAKAEVVILDHHVYFDLDAGYRPKDDEAVILQRKGQLIVTPHTLEASVNEEAFTLFRLENNIPLFGVDYKKDDFILNVSAEDFVSFTKGCFLGQEPISKVHSRSKPTWKLVVKKEDECSSEERAKMTSKAKGRGFVFVKNE